MGCVCTSVHLTDGKNKQWLENCVWERGKNEKQNLKKNW